MRKTSPVGGTAPSAETDAGQTAEHADHRLPGLEASEVHADADMGPGGEGEMAAPVRAAQIEPIWVGELGRVPVGGSERDHDEVAGADRGPGDARRARRVAIHPRRGGLEAQRLLHRRRGEIGLRPHLLQRVRVGEQMPERVEDQALGRLDPAEQDHGCIRDHLVVRERARRDLVDMCSELITECGHRLGSRRGRCGAGGDPGHRRDDVAVPPDEPGHDGVVAPVEPEALGDDRRGERRREVAAQLGRATVGRIGDRRQSTVDLLGDEATEPGRHLARPERGREGRPVAVVLGVIERQHARPDDLGGREPRVGDRERLGVAQYVQRGGSPGDDEPADRGHPRHGGQGAQPC